MEFVTHVVPSSTVRSLGGSILGGTLVALRSTNEMTVKEAAEGAGCTDLGSFSNWPEAQQIYNDLIARGYTPDAARDSAGKLLGRVFRHVLDQYFVYEKLPTIYRKSRYRIIGLKKT